MQIKLGIIMDPLAEINYKKDSSLAMLWAAQDKKWALYYIQPQHLFIENGTPKAIGQSLKVFHDDQRWFAVEAPVTLDLADFDVLLMRKDPPFDNEYIYNTYLLESAENAGVLVVNKPSSLRDYNEKIFATHFPQCCPPHLVTSNSNLLKAFHLKYKDVIFKPLDGMGGSKIFRLKADDPNVTVIIETLTAFGKETIMAQQFIPDIVNGDKRILIVDGEPIPFALARIPAKGETRGNLAAGGTGVAKPLTARDYWICEQIIPTLKEKGLMFVGIDVIGEYLTEINITSPTCIRELDDAYGLNIAGKLMDAIEKQLSISSKGLSSSC